MTHPLLASFLKQQRDASYEYMASMSGTSDSEEEESHNTWNALLELLTMPGSIQRSIFDWELCRVALSCHFALDVIYMSMEWCAGERLRYAQTQHASCLLRIHESTGEAAETW